MSDHEAKQATPHATLLAELLDSRIPKSEREHAAKREIERLTAERDETMAKLANLFVAFNDWKVFHSTTRLEVELQLKAAENDELRRQLAEAELDAERYRWLRNEANTARKCDPMVCIYPLDEQDLIDGDRLDIAIDAAMGLTRPAEE